MVLHFLLKAVYYELYCWGVGGAILGVFGTQSYMTGGLGIFTLPTFISPEDGITAGFWEQLFRWLFL